MRASVAADLSVIATETRKRGSGGLSEKIEKTRSTRTRASDSSLIATETRTGQVVYRGHELGNIRRRLVLY